MPTRPAANLALKNLRSSDGGATAAFEEFCCQLFRREEVPMGSAFRRIRGAGGDGGVESVWLLPTGGAWGVQAKAFTKLGSSEKAQMEQSLHHAVANYPNLTRYTFCIPITLTGPKAAGTKKPSKGQHELLAGWIKEWTDDLAKKGKTVAIEAWDEPALLQKLATADTTGGLSRYWFDVEVYTDHWFEERLSYARAQAGPRYTPTLNVETPADLALQAFGRADAWAQRVESAVRKYEEEVEGWRTAVEGTRLPSATAPESVLDEGRALLKLSEEIQRDLEKVLEIPETLVALAFQASLRRALDMARDLEPKVKAALEEIHGPNADSPGFRQFRAEYQVDFPMAPLDQIRDLGGALNTVATLAFDDRGRLPSANAMLLRGVAGIGKTHAIIDAAQTRAKAGLRSVVVFGEDFSDTDPWTTIAGRLGLRPGDSRDTQLDALNAAGDASGLPFVIFIDALNETQPDRKRWLAWLPPLVEQVGRHPFLKLCVSCRDTYLSQVVPGALQLPTVEHNGFLGREYEALAAFFKHYNLGPPAEPLLQHEFGNPLFLRLVCESLAETAEKAIQAGRAGFRALVNLLLKAKNDKAAVACDYDPRTNRVAEAVSKLARAMADRSTRTLPLDQSTAIVNGTTPGPHSTSLHVTLESEGLISVVETPPASPGGPPVHTTRFTFERVADHLIAEQLLTGISDPKEAFKPGGRLHFLVKDQESASLNAGLSEALAIHLPETHNIELQDAASAVSRDFLLTPFLQSLTWRDPEKITRRTMALIQDAEGPAPDSEPRPREVFQALLLLAPRPNHPLNALYLDRQLRRTDLLARDPFWAFVLEDSYSGWSETVSETSAVNRLITTALQADLSALPQDVATLWAIGLAWFCASPDRRIRDRATLAIVRILIGQPKAMKPLFERLLDVDDEYIIERVLVAGYGALLTNPNEEVVAEVSLLLYRDFFDSDALPLNASIRDHARLIIEIGVDRKICPSSINLKKVRPPYNSQWPIAFPKEQDIKHLVEDKKRFPNMSLLEQFGLALGTDFARYVVEPRTRDFDLDSAGITQPDILRWFLQKAERLGYPGWNDQAAKFDRMLVGAFGPGRGKPGWAERLGKKYYWIFLRQLVGAFADHLPTKDWRDDTFPPGDDLQGLDLRDIDPTDLRAYADRTDQDGWVRSPLYAEPSPTRPQDDAAWIEVDDLPKIEEGLGLLAPDGTQWHVLSQTKSWRGKRQERRERTYRDISRSIHSMTCKTIDIDRVKSAFASGVLEYFDSEPHDYRGYLEEYPHGWPYRRRLGDTPRFYQPQADIDFEHVELLQLRGGEWERDYSGREVRDHLLMPSPALIGFADLDWDGRGSWLHSNGQRQAFDPNWAEQGSPGLIARADYLDGYLVKNDLALVSIGYQTKRVLGNMDGAEFVEERTLLIRTNGKTTLVQRKVERRGRPRKGPAPTPGEEPEESPDD